MQGISAWAFNVLPAVFPFMILSQLLLSTGYIEKVCKPFSPIFKKAYKTSSYSFYVFFVSILSGYPVGSKMIADLYEQDRITKKDAFVMSSFCSNSGPMFIVGAVGIGMLCSAKAGYVMLLSHIIGAILNGFLYRNLKIKESEKTRILAPTTQPTFGDIIENSCKSILSVGGIIMFFFIVIEFVSLIISPLSPELQSIIFGMVEITKGSLTISQIFPLKMATIISTVVITFGGISTALQSISLLKRVQMPLGLFLLQKLTQAIFAGVIAFVLSLLMF